MSTPHRSRHGRRSLVLAAATLAGLALATSLTLVTPAGARDLQELRGQKLRGQEFRGQAVQPRKTVKLPTRPSQRPHKVRPDRVQARPGADRVRARPGRYHRHQAEPRVRDYRDQRRYRHGG